VRDHRLSLGAYYWFFTQRREEGVERGRIQGVPEAPGGWPHGLELVGLDSLHARPRKLEVGGAAGRG